MKKKILSIALVLGMLLSIISSIPVSAAGEAYDRSLPYAFYDYEDGVNNLQGAEIVDGGIAGSGKCLKYISTNSDVVQDDKSIFLGNGAGAVSGLVPANHTFKVSFNIKITQQLTKGNLVLFVNYKKASGGTAQSTPLKTFDPTKVGEWQKIEFEAVTPTENVEITGLKLRYAGHGAHLDNGNFVVGGGYDTPREYYFDDMEFTVTSPYQRIPGSGGSSDDSDDSQTPQAPALMTLADYNMDFENGSSVLINGSHVTTTEANKDDKAKTQLIADPTDSNNTVMKVWLASDVDGEGYLNGRSEKMKMTFAASTQTTASVTGTVPAGATLKLSFRYYLPQEVASSNAPSFCWYYNRGSVAHLDPVSAPSTVANQWHTVEMIWANTSSTAQDRAITQGGFRICGNNDSGTGWKKSWMLAGKTGGTAGNYDLGDRAIYFDDFKFVIDDPNAAPPPEEAVLSLDSYAMDFETDSSIQVNGANVTDVEAGTTDELAVITADPADENNKVMKLTTTSAYAASASTIKFSGAAGAGTDKVTAPGSIPAGGKITYKFKYYLASEVDATNAPAFSVKHATGNVTAVSADAFATEANVWHEAKLTATNNGASALGVDEATLRLAGDDANATQWKTTDGDTVIYFDDFTVETAEPAFPTSAGLRFTGDFVAGEEVTFYHTYTPTEEGAEDNSIVRFLSTVDGETGSLGSCMIGDKSTVPAVPKGANLSFEVVPVDSGILGVKIPYSYASVVGQDAHLALSGFAADGSVTAEAVIDNQRFDGSDINAVLIVVLLNDKGGVIKYEEKPLVCANGETITGTDGALRVETDNADPAQSRVTKAAAFLWYCDGSNTASFTNTTLVELVEDEMVTKQ